MKATKNNLIVKSYQHQKEELVITGPGGKPINLYIGKQYVENHREKNPVIAEVIDNNSDYEHITTGDLILVHHNMVSTPLTNPRCLEYNPQTGEAVFSIPARGTIVFAKLDKDGETIPLFGNIIAERIYDCITSSLIVIPDTVNTKEKKMVDVLRVAPEVDDVKPGDRVVMMPMSDYEICYTFNKKDFSVIRLYREDDVLATIDKKYKGV